MIMRQKVEAWEVLFIKSHQMRSGRVLKGDGVQHPNFTNEETEIWRN